MHRTWLCGRPSSVPQCATMYLEGCSAGSRAATLSVVARRNIQAERNVNRPARAFWVLKAGRIKILHQIAVNRGSLIDHILEDLALLLSADWVRSLSVNSASNFAKPGTM